MFLTGCPGHRAGVPPAAPQWQPLQQGRKGVLGFCDVVGGLEIPWLKPRYIFFQEMFFFAVFRKQHAFALCGRKNVTVEA